MDTNVQEVSKIVTGKLVLIDKEDEAIFNQYKWHVTNLGYVRGYLNRSGKRILLHRLLFPVSNTSNVIDHINGNGLDNRKSNLRECTNSQNLANRGATLGRKFKGVSWSKERKKYEAKIMVNYKTIHLGRHINEIDAAKAYNEAAIKYFGEFSKLNIIT